MRLLFGRVLHCMISFSRLGRIAFRIQFDMRLRSLGLSPKEFTVSSHTLPLKDNRALFISQLSCLSPDTGELVTFSGMDDQRRCISIEKAISEFLEAKLFWHLRFDWRRGRSGFATAPTLQEAVNTAYKELIERDSFLMHLLCPTLKSAKLPNITYPISVRASALQSVDPNIKVVLAAHRPDSQSPWTLGLGASSTLELAARKALFEVLMVDSSRLNPNMANTKRAPRLECYMEHWIASTHTSVSSRIENILEGGGHKTTQFRVKPDELKLVSSSLLDKEPRATVCVEHPELIPLTFGELWELSKTRVNSLLIDRTLEPDTWVKHPLL